MEKIQTGLGLKAAYAAAVVISGVALYVTSLESYLLFHCMAELFSIIIAAGIFVVAWNTRHFQPNAYLLFIGSAYLHVAFIDILHTLAYKGMGVFPGADANLPTQFWIAARYLEAVSLFIAPFFLGKKPRMVPIGIAYFVATALVLLSIYSTLFPDAFIEGRGLTPFKIVSEYIVSLILAAAIVFLRKKKACFEKPVLNLLTWSIFMTIASEMTFTLYHDVYGLFNLIGHYFKIVSFYLVYTALIERNLKKPYVSLVHEVEERKRVEKALLNAKKQWEDTFDAVWDWVAIIDKNHTIVRSSKAVKNFINLSPNQVVGKCCYRVVHGMDDSISDCPLKRAVKSRQRENMEIQIKDRRWIQVSVDPIQSENGKDLFVHIVRDITEAKNREQEIIAARKADAFSVLSGGIAHDYNNLLTMIWGNISLLKDDLTDTAHKEILEAASDACALSKTLPHQFLTLSKGAILKKTICDINHILRAVIEIVSQTEKIDISVHESPELPAIEVDSDQVKLAFRNIIVNAQEAMAEGGQLNIRVAEESSPKEMMTGGNCLKILFADTGTGICPADLPKVFDPYFSTKDRGAQKGMGLGLSVAQSIISKHGGRITIDSVFGQGTTVSVHLPVTVPEAPSLLEQVAAVEQDKPLVLLMEDEPALRKLYQRMLEKFGYAAMAAANSAEIASIFQYVNQNDLAVAFIILDQNIKGGIGGAETLKKLRQSGFAGKAILVTGSPGSQMISDYKKHGFDGRLLKPFIPKDLKEVIDAL